MSAVEMSAVENARVTTFLAVSPEGDQIWAVSLPWRAQCVANLRR